MFLYTVGNAMDGGAEFLCRGVHVSKARSVARCMNMLRRRRREGHPVFAGQRAGSEDGSESYAIQEPADAARVRKNFTCLATKMHGHSRYPLLELVAHREGCVARERLPAVRHIRGAVPVRLGPDGTACAQSSQKLY